MERCDLALVGGGHAHCGVLADWVQRGPPVGVRTVLITPQPFLTYSGMVPGWIAGEHRLEAGQVNLAALATRAGVQVIAGQVAGLDPAARVLRLADGGAVPFAVASLDAGGVGRAEAVLGADSRLIEVRPMDDFVVRLAAWRAANRPGARRIAVVGGGAGGVELALACAQMAGLAARCEVLLVTGERGLLPDFGAALRRLAARELARQQIAIIPGKARLAGGALHADERVLEPIDLILAATGSAAPAWPRAGGLAVDPHGFVAVDQHQRSLSHPWILAAGDIAARADREVARSGVHAVRAGPVLAANLRCVLAGEPPRRTYRPRPASLYLIACGNGTALASYGRLAARGRWAQRLKRWIDTRWIAQYARLASPPRPGGQA